MVSLSFLGIQSPKETETIRKKKKISVSVLWSLLHSWAKIKEKPSRRDLHHSQPPFGSPLSAADAWLFYGSQQVHRSMEPAAAEEQRMIEEMDDNRIPDSANNQWICESVDITFAESSEKRTRRKHGRAIKHQKLGGKFSVIIPFISLPFMSHTTEKKMIEKKRVGQERKRCKSWMCSHRLVPDRDSLSTSHETLL